MNTSTATQSASDFCQARPAEFTNIFCKRGPGHSADTHTHRDAHTGRVTTWKVAR